MTDIYAEFSKWWDEKTVEPVLRNKDGIRYHGHRFPIKGGISRREAFVKFSLVVSPSVWEALLKS